ncbi:MAG: BamA/TamA family outer membrane protein [Acidobacteria bacterium]|nr:BamA/TamA family outer membrane protein [Acidobacteriota bacterium]
MPVPRSLITIAALFLSSGAALAQDPSSRAEELARQQEQKARELSPYTRGWLERKLLEAEASGGLFVPRGFFVTFSDIKSGSGFAAGPAYGKLWENGALFQAKAVYSIREFKLLQISGRGPRLAGGRVMLNGRARWQDAPEVAVFPLGQGAPRTRANYSETKTEVSGQATFVPVRWIRLSAGAAYESYETEAVSDAGDAALVLAAQPGLGADPDYFRSSVSAAIDGRTGLGFSRSGTRLQATLHDYRQQNDGPYSFQRVDAIAQQLIPILHGNWVLDLSVRASTTTADGGDTVPFFLMPTLGGSRGLRGYQSYRFRDRHSIVLTAEYRWYVQEYVDMAVFYDAGKVASRRSDLDFDGLKSGVGFGIRFHAPQSTILRLELARGTEGIRYIISFGPVIR